MQYLTKSAYQTICIKSIKQTVYEQFINKCNPKAATTHHCTMHMNRVHHQEFFPVTKNSIVCNVYPTRLDVHWLKTSSHCSAPIIVSGVITSSFWSRHYTIGGVRGGPPAFRTIPARGSDRCGFVRGGWEDVAACWAGAHGRGGEGQPPRSRGQTGEVAQGRGSQPGPVVGKWCYHYLVML